MSRLDGNSTLENGKLYKFSFQSVGKIAGTAGELADRLRNMRDTLNESIEGAPVGLTTLGEHIVSVTFIYNGEEDQAASFGAEMADVLSGSFYSPGQYSFLYADSDVSQPSTPILGSNTKLIFGVAAIAAILLLVYGFGQGFGARAGVAV